MNLASRLASVAGSGEVPLSDKTWRLLDGAVGVEARGELAAKGKAQPVQVYLAGAPRPPAPPVLRGGAGP